MKLWRAQSLPAVSRALMMAPEGQRLYLFLSLSFPPLPLPLFFSLSVSPFLSRSPSSLLSLTHSLFLSSSLLFSALSHCRWFMKVSVFCLHASSLPPATTIEEAVRRRVRRARQRRAPGPRSVGGRGGVPSSQAGRGDAELLLKRILLEVLHGHGSACCLSVEANVASRQVTGANRGRRREKSRGVQAWSRHEDTADSPVNVDGWPLMDGTLSEPQATRQRKTAHNATESCGHYISDAMLPPHAGLVGLEGPGAGLQAERCLLVRYRAEPRLRWPSRTGASGMMMTMVCPGLAWLTEGKGGGSSHHLLVHPRSLPRLASPAAFVVPA